MFRESILASLLNRVSMVVLICALAATAFAQDQGDSGKHTPQIIVSGSSNLQPFVETWVSAFTGSTDAPTFLVEGAGTSQGIDDLLNGRAQIAMASRSMNDEERLEAEKNGLNIRETVVARMGIAVIVTKGNPIASLTIGEIASIFSGESTNWQAFGGPDQQINVVRKESGWSPEFFHERIMGDKDFSGAAVIVDSKEDVVELVGIRPWTIGFTGMPEAIPALDRVGLVRIVSDSSNTDATYALSRPLYFYTIEGTAAVEPFLDYTTGPEAQGMIIDAGFYPANQTDAVEVE
jgi:phosphate transport system substrate-binding protein